MCFALSRCLWQRTTIVGFLFSVFALSITDQGAVGEPGPRLMQQMYDLHRRGRNKEAISVAHKISAATEKRYGKQHERYAQALSNLALLYDIDKRHHRAERLYRRALQILEKRRGVSDAQVAQVLNNLAAAVLAQCRPGQAETLYKRAAKIYLAIAGPNHPDTRRVHQNLQKLAGVTTPKAGTSSQNADADRDWTKPQPRRLPAIAACAT